MAPAIAPPLRCARALVLGGGGVAGIAWMIGLVAGLARAGVLLGNADVIVGTSAGSVVGVHLAGGTALEPLLAEQLCSAADGTGHVQPYSQAMAGQRNRKLLAKLGGDLDEARRRIGAFALRAATPPSAERLAIIAARLPATAWPGRTLRLVAVDAETGMGRVFDRNSGACLVEAVAASCAVPGSWPAVELGNRRYIDGGIRSMTNADVAAGAARVVVLSPFGYAADNPVSGHLAAEVAGLERGAAMVLVLEPDDASREAIGDDVLDPARRSPSARAGLTQAPDLAASASRFWAAGAPVQRAPA